MSSLPRRQRVAAYAVIVRDGHVLLSRLAPRVTKDELWTLPGGGLDHGEDPRDAVVREVHEETGLRAEVGDVARVYSAHLPGAWREGRRVDAHALRIVYAGRVPPDSPEPRVVEVDGSTVEAAWVPLAAVRAGEVPVVPMVTEALADLLPQRRQRVGAYAVVRRGGPQDPSGRSRDEVLLTRNSVRGPHPGQWALPGGGVEHGEPPTVTVAREVREETGVEVEVGNVLGVHDTHFVGTAPNGATEDFHGVHLLYAARAVDDAVEPRVLDEGGTTDAAAWHAVEDVLSGAVDVRDTVRYALGL
ncbi:NUDIX domain-containing protein [Nocardioides sp. ChNu-153]|uniref:NUDIX domain-containing protein n=1 Tax=unclassified Nocardioides TaxID=2615069 RepID=UPI0024075FDE|nr:MULTISPECIES: NUDIX domain-containing protein [unclassified Nocardioides]MDF9714534.1 NUDIX domain-containing protein [Nocardioides sp. ChNu-99]MDN7119933.1 NUDIX domain-containing protein [Nocardioides sp. ChNu-153]